VSTLPAWRVLHAAAPGPGRGSVLHCSAPARERQWGAVRLLGRPFCLGRRSVV